AFDRDTRACDFYTLSKLPAVAAQREGVARLTMCEKEKQVLGLLVAATAALPPASAACKDARSMADRLACRSITAGSSRSSPNTKCAAKSLCGVEGKRLADVAGPTPQRPRPTPNWAGAR